MAYKLQLVVKQPSRNLPKELYCHVTCDGEVGEMVGLLSDTTTIEIEIFWDVYRLMIDSAHGRKSRGATRSERAE